MTAYVGTVVFPAKGGERGQEYTGLGKYALTGALVNADTITWTNLLPNGATCKIIDVQFEAPELDTDASPTATAILGDGTTTNGYITTFNLGMPAQAPANGVQILASGNGAIIGLSTQASNNVVFTVNGVVATGATTGTLWVRVRVQGI